MSNHMSKIVIIVEGGVIQDVYSSNDSDKVEVIDHDNMKEEGISRDKRNTIEQAAIQGMATIY